MAWKKEDESYRPLDNYTRWHLHQWIDAHVATDAADEAAEIELDMIEAAEHNQDWLDRGWPALYQHCRAERADRAERES